MTRVEFTHYKDGTPLSVSGEIPKNLNNQNSDYLFVEKSDGRIEAVLKTTITKIEKA